MEENKNTVAQERNVTNQEAIVKRMSRGRVVRKKRIIIPGGRTLLADATKEGLTDSIYVWLRACRFFSEVTLSIPAEIKEIDTRDEVVVTFDASQVHPPWVSDAEGKLSLAREMADALFNNKCLGVRVDRTGIYLIQDKSDSFAFDPEDASWAPYIEFTPERNEEYA